MKHKFIVISRHGKIYNTTKIRIAGFKETIGIAIVNPRGLKSAKKSVIVGE